MNVIQENLSSFIESKYRVRFDPERHALLEKEFKEIEKKPIDQKSKGKLKSEIWEKLVDEIKTEVYSKADRNLKVGIDNVRKKGILDSSHDPIFYRRHVIDAILFKLSKKDENSVKIWADRVRGSSVEEQPYKPVLLDVIELVEKRQFNKIKDLVF